MQSFKLLNKNFGLTIIFKCPYLGTFNYNENLFELDIKVTYHSLKENNINKVCRYYLRIIIIKPNLSLNSFIRKFGFRYIILNFHLNP